MAVTIYAGWPSGLAGEQATTTTGRTKFHHRFHKEVEYLRRKSRAICDAFPLPRSIAGESADGEFSQAPVFWRRPRKIIARNAPRFKSPSPKKTSDAKLGHDFLFYLEDRDRPADAPLRRHRKILQRAKFRAANQQNVDLPVEIPPVIPMAGMCSDWQAARPRYNDFLKSEAAITL